MLTVLQEVLQDSLYLVEFGIARRLKLLLVFHELHSLQSDVTVRYFRR